MNVIIPAVVATYLLANFTLSRFIRSRIDHVVTDTEFKNFVKNLTYSSTGTVKTVSECLKSCKCTCIESSIVAATYYARTTGSSCIVVLFFISLRWPVAGLHSITKVGNTVYDLTGRVCITGRFPLIRYVLFSLFRAKTFYIPITALRVNAIT